MVVTGGDTPTIIHAGVDGMFNKNGMHEQVQDLE